VSALKKPPGDRRVAANKQVSNEPPEKPPRRSRITAASNRTAKRKCRSAKLEEVLCRGKVKIMIYHRNISSQRFFAKQLRIGKSRGFHEAHMS
jgi:hypothetical protein